jgi:phosphoglycerate dehydrogenase-like enzyme
MKHFLVHGPVDPAALRGLEALDGVSLDVCVTDEEPHRSFDPQRLAGVHVYFGCYLPKNFEDMGSLEFVQITSTGYSQLLGYDLPERGIRASNAAGVFDAPIAEWCVAMMVNMARDLRGMIRDQEGGRFESRAEYQPEIRGSTVGFWGYGGLARATARLCKAMGLTVWALTRNGVRPRQNVYCVPDVGDPEGTLPDRVFLAEQRDEFLAGLDFLIMGVPISNETTGLVGERELKILPNRVLVLNPARGPLINEKALVCALKEGWIAGAALDAHHHYPMPADHPLRFLPNVILTPHISGSIRSPHYLRRLWDIFSTNAKNFIDGNPPINKLSETQLSAAPA